MSQICCIVQRLKSYYLLTDKKGKERLTVETNVSIYDFLHRNTVHLPRNDQKNF